MAENLGHADLLLPTSAYPYVLQVSAGHSLCCMLRAKEGGGGQCQEETLENKNLLPFSFTLTGVSHP